MNVTSRDAVGAVYFGNFSCNAGNLIAEDRRGGAIMDDGLQGLTAVEPRKPFGIMPNRQH